MTNSSQASTSGEPSGFDLTPAGGRAGDLRVDVRVGHGDVLLLARLLQNLAADHPFQDLRAVPRDALLGQFADRDLRRR